MGMKLAAEDLASYEGLVFTTAQRYAAIVGLEVEDLQQILRIKVWQALGSYDPRRLGATKQDAQRYTFMCIRNKIKDLMRDRKAALDRDEPDAKALYIEDVAPTEEGEQDSFFLRYLCATADEVFAMVEEGKFQLPSTLTQREVDIILLLMLDHTQKDIAEQFGYTRVVMRRALAGIRVKMADWAPPAAAVPATSPAVAA